MSDDEDAVEAVAVAVADELSPTVAASKAAASATPIAVRRRRGAADPRPETEEEVVGEDGEEGEEGGVKLKSGMVGSLALRRSCRPPPYR
ncbi:hypothetical protein [Streptomyces decoyicus]